MSVKIIFLDIDGTLVSFKSHQIPTTTLEAIAAVRRRGIKVYIATGRPVFFIDNLSSLEYDGMITVTGAHCFTRSGRVIADSFVPLQDVERLIDYHQHHKNPFPVIFVCQDELFATAINEDVHFIMQYLDVKHIPIKNIKTARGKKIFQMIAFFGAAKEKDYMQTLMPGCSSMRWHPLFTDIIAKGTSKSSGIDRVLEYEKISLQDTMAFGDGGNDIPMLSHVNSGVAMGNASDELKALADYVTDDVDNNGVRNALLHFGVIT